MDEHLDYLVVDALDVLSKESGLHPSSKSIPQCSARACLQSQPEHEVGEVLPQWFVGAIEHLQSHFDETAVRGPDYRPTEHAHVRSN